MSIKGGSKQSLRSNLSEEALSEIKEIFDIFDSDKSGSIDRHELKVCLRSLGFDLTKQDILAIMKEKDPKGNGYLDFRSFSSVIAEKTAQRKPEEEYRKVFSLFDKENLGKINFKQLKRVNTELGGVFPDDQLESMIKQFDEDGDGFITVDDFIKILDPSSK